MIQILVNAMERGVEVLNWTPQPEKYKNDNVHPCVRYIPNFAGHDWWMVATPYPNSDSSAENPILYYGDSGDGGVPPTSWQGGAIVEEVVNRDPNPRRAQILSSYQMAKKLYNGNNVYAEKVGELYRILTDYSYIMRKYKDFDLGNNYNEAVSGCTAYIAEYDAFAAALNNRNLSNTKIAKSLLGW
jgi:hypothetical protein